MSQARIQVVIFDVGGVLVRTEDWTPRQQWEERLGLEPNSLEPIVHNSPIGRAAQQGQVTNREYWTVLGDRLRLDPASRSVFESDFYAGDRVDPVWVDYIRSLRPRFQTALLSNAMPWWRDRILNEYGLDDIFDVMVFSCEEGMAKPDPAIFQRVLDRVGVSAAESVFVDDSLINIQAAQALGMKTVHFTDAKAAMAELEAMLNVIRNT